MALMKAELLVASMENFSVVMMVNQMELTEEVGMLGLEVGNIIGCIDGLQVGCALGVITGIEVG
jgi:hypothetical protein